MSTDKPALERFAGSEVAIDESGNYHVDTQGAESGHQHFRLHGSARLTVEVDGGGALEVYKEGGAIRVDLVRGADQRLVLGDALKTLLNEFFQTKFDLHVHPTSMGPSGPPLPPFTGSRMTDDHLSDAVKTKRR